MINEYDNEQFFHQYAGMARSRGGLAAAGEWHQFRRMFPALAGKRVLDLGCGYGWHCKYAADQGAAEVLGLDLSEKMISEAKRQNSDPAITYRVCGLEDYDYPESAWDCVVSNLAMHYVENLDATFAAIHKTLVPEGLFLLNMEHPVFTAGVGQDWIYDADGNAAYWPVDNYFYPGERLTHFLGCEVRKQHHTLTQILMGLLNNGFALEAVEEAMPAKELRSLPEMADEMRRPMMLLVRARAM